MDPISQSDIKRSFICANDEIKVTQTTLPNYQNSMYTSRLINTKEIKLAYESTKFRGRNGFSIVGRIIEQDDFYKYDNIKDDDNQ
ncbi:21345_t:CDS:2, partial [Cetraspora pellucida]